ncbi:hypothetical protein DMUE_4824 [Dictyocoela muelleri]|nr:hypothetical protein DMUE_4824 [Dictyocoela muelleri]
MPSLTNKTDALCIIEFYYEILCFFAFVIENKLETPLVPIICLQVVANSTIWTYEHHSYTNLNELNYTNDTVCHKYIFINGDSGANTQAVECFNNLFKEDIKLKMGVKTENHGKF